MRLALHPANRMIQIGEGDLAIDDQITFCILVHTIGECIVGRLVGIAISGNKAGEQQR